MPVIAAAVCRPGICAPPLLASDAFAWFCTCSPPEEDWLAALAGCLLTTLSSSPLLTNPATPFPLSEPLYWWALTEKFGSESPPMVCRTPSEYPVTTST